MLNGSFRREEVIEEAQSVSACLLYARLAGRPIRTWEPIGVLLDCRSVGGLRSCLLLFLGMKKAAETILDAVPQQLWQVVRLRLFENLRKLTMQGAAECWSVGLLS